jgi:HEAT repeat protein
MDNTHSPVGRAVMPGRQGRVVLCVLTLLLSAGCAARGPAGGNLMDRAATARDVAQRREALRLTAQAPEPGMRGRLEERLPMEPDVAARVFAVRALAKLGVEASAPALRDAVHTHTHYVVRIEALEALVDVVGEEALGECRRVAASGTPAGRVAADPPEAVVEERARALALAAGLCGAQERRRLLAGALEDDEEAIRLVAADLLTRGWPPDRPLPGPDRWQDVLADEQ